MKLIYSHPLDQRLRSATSIEVRQGVVLSPETDTDKLHDWNPASPFRIAGTTLELVIDHGSAVGLGLVVPAIHSTVDVEMVIQRNDTDAWTSPVVDETVEAPAIDLRGIFSAPRIDLTNNALDEYPALQYSRLLITNNARPITIGESFWGAATRAFSTHFGHGLRFSRQASTVRHRTLANVDLAYERAVSVRALSGEIWLNDAELVLFEAWRDATREDARPFLLIPDSRRQDAWVARFDAGDVDLAPIGGSDHWRVAFPLIQIGPGLAWIDPDDG